MALALRPRRRRRSRTPSFESQSTTSKPIPGKYYRIKRGGGGLLTTTSRAYGVGPGAERMALAQRINRHPFNRKFWVAPKSAFNRRYFPGGIISFNPQFSCDLDQRRATRGQRRCFARIWIPPRRQRIHRTLGPLISSPSPSSLEEAPASIGPAEIKKLLGSQCIAMPNPDDVCLTKDSDERRVLEHTRGIPQRWACKLFVNYPGSDDWATASGFLFGDNHVVTSAHVLTDRIQVTGAEKRSVRVVGASRIIVVPAMNGLPDSFSPIDPAAIPFGMFEVRKWQWKEGKKTANFRVSPEYLGRIRMGSAADDDDPAEYDYGIIDISKRRALTKGDLKRGNWGATKRSKAIAIVADGGTSRDIRHLLLKAKSSNKGVKIAGYPADHPCNMVLVPDGEMIRFAYNVDSLHNVLQHVGDNARGMSGGPVWYTQKKRRRDNTLAVRHWLIGINAACVTFDFEPAASDTVRYQMPARTPNDALFNAVTLITPTVLARLRDPSTMSPVP